MKKYVCPWVVCYITTNLQIKFFGLKYISKQTGCCRFENMDGWCKQNNKFQVDYFESY